MNGLHWKAQKKSEFFIFNFLNNLQFFNQIPILSDNLNGISHSYTFNHIKASCYISLARKTSKKMLVTYKGLINVSVDLYDTNK